MLFVLMLVLAVTPLAMSFHFSRKTRCNAIKPIDLGQVFTWLVFLYAFLPVLGIWLASQGIGSLADQRLGGKQPDLVLVQAVAQNYVAFMVAFALAYSTTRRPSMLQPVVQQAPTFHDLRAVVLLVCFVKLASFVLQIGFGSDASDSYIGSYTALRGQPILVQQLAGVLTASDFASTVLLIFVAVAYKPKLWPYISAAVILQVSIAVMGGGSRTNAFLYALAFMVARSFYDRRLSARILILYGVIGVALFLLGGLLRSGFDSAEGSLNLQIIQGGEFLSVFYNSLDLLGHLGDAELDAVKLGVYLVDLLRLIPQQIIGDIKVDPSTFYVSTFYPEFSDAGGGLAFGAIAESSIGFGWPEALLRGALLGCLYSTIANQCLNGKFTVVRGFIYVWFVVMSYQSIRDTTFSTIPRFAIQVLPLLVLLKVAGVFKHKRSLRITPRDGILGRSA